MERRILGDGGVGAVDPRTADLEVRLAGAGIRIDCRVDHCRVEVGAGGITGTGCVAAAPWLPFGCGTWRSAFTVAQLTCFCATNIPTPEMKIWSPSWRRLRALGPPTASSGRMKIDDKSFRRCQVARSSASALESLIRCVVWPSWTYAPSVPLSPVSRHRARRLHELLPKAGIVVIDLILGAGQPDRTISDADVLLRQHPAEDGLRYLNLQPSTDPNHLSPENLAVTILINSRAGPAAFRSAQNHGHVLDIGNCLMCRWRRLLLVNAPRSPVSSTQSRTGRDLQPQWQPRFSTRNGPS
jgi:hypothetical protein